MSDQTLDSPVSSLAGVRDATAAPIVPVFRVVSGETDAQLVRTWLTTKPNTNTRAAYQRDIGEFLWFVGVPLRELTLEIMQNFVQQLEVRQLETAAGPKALEATTRKRKISAVKSLLTFATKVGYLPFNIGAAVSQPPTRNRLAERILAESQVQRMIALEVDPRNHALIRLFYASGARVSELCGLKARDLQARRDHRSSREAGQVVLYGKGGKTRTVLVSVETWADLQSLTAEAAPDDPVFRSRKRKHGGHLTRSTVLRIVRAAASRAGVEKKVSPHWLRHAHASHALDRGAPAHLVRDTLGHGSIATTNQYLHARPDESSSQYLGV
jgi:integrase/recombinase XerD